MLSNHDYKSKRRSVGHTIYTLRRRAGLSGSALGAAVGISQASISRIENGYLAPTEHQVLLICEALKANSDTKSGLISQARMLTATQIDLASSVAGTFVESQVQALAHETIVTSVATFAGLYIPSQMQTLAYVNSIAKTLVNPVSGRLTTLENRVDELTQGRMQRQALLYDNKRSFRFLLLEQALTFLMVEPHLLVDQLKALKYWSARTNIDIALVPRDKVAPVMPVYVYTVIDGGTVAVETATGDSFHQDSEIVSYYRAHFDSLWGAAVFDDEVGLRIDRAIEELGLLTQA